MRQSHLVLKVSKLSKLNNELKNGFFRRPRRRRHRHLSVCFASSVYLLFPTRPVPRSVSQSAAVGDGDGGLLFLPSFLPSLSNVCESRTDRASGRARGRGSGRKDDKIISASEWIAVPQCDISHPPFPPCYQATRLHGASILQAGVSVAQDGVARRCSTILALAEYQEEKRDLPTLSYHQISFL